MAFVSQISDDKLLSMFENESESDTCAHVAKLTHLTVDSSLRPDTVRRIVGSAKRLVALDLSGKHLEQQQQQQQQNEFD